MITPMPRLPVVVGPLSLFNTLSLHALVFKVCILCLFVLAFITSSLSYGQQVKTAESDQRYLARIELNTSAELGDILRRAEKLFSDNSYQSIETPVALLLHGPEAKVFLRENYELNREIVDLAARLSAFKIVDIKVCETWMGGEGIEGSGLHPFIETIPYAPGEEKEMLEEKGYVYF